MKNLREIFSFEFGVKEIQILLAGVVLPISSRQEVHPNGTLEIRDVSREADTGTYTCVALAMEHTTREELKVEVMGKY